VPLFQYTASDQTGSLSKGELEARDKAAATRALSSRGLFVLEIKASVCSKSSLPADAPQTPITAAPVEPEALADPKQALNRAGQATKGDGTGPRRRIRWPGMQQAIYLRQLNVLFDAGIPIHQAASVLGDSDEYRAEVKEVLLQIPRDLERGRMLSKCMEKSGLFGRVVISSIRLGEETGRLDKILVSLADAKEESVKLKRTLVSRLTYPIVVMTVMSLGLLVMGHVMSRVMSSLPNFNPTDVPLFGLASQIFQHKAFLPIGLIGVGAGCALTCHIYRTPRLRMAVERQILALPIVGQLLSRIEANTITRHISLLLSAGLPIDRGLELCSELVWTECFRQALCTSRDDIRAGVELADCFKASELFPQDTLALITAGEVSGQLEGSLKRAAEYCSGQVERTLETLLALIEPLLIGCLGITIGAILLCTFVPVFNSLQTM
jgi:type IV pilus assembly protein PilC